MFSKAIDRLKNTATPRELLHTGAALALCLTVLLLDISTTSDITEAFLLPLAYIAIYPIRRDWATALVAAAAIATAVAGGLLEDAGEALSAVAINRGMVVVVLVGVGFLLHRVTASERQLFRIATTDPLTGINNRRHFMTLLGRERDRALRYGTSFSLLMIDIDHFKRINDSYGHPAGDEAIKAMAGAAVARLRPTDIIGRFGGEEFVVMLPQTDEQGAIRAAERIREAVEQVVLTAGGHRISFTVSLGAATFARRAGLDQLVECADQALYAAKTGGRNRVCTGRLVETPAAATGSRLATA